ncbi:hypothetical protein CsSME_00053489 [Camellia sinensis var. sinensis]
MDRDTRCNIPSPPENPPMLQIPLPNDRATRNPLTPVEDLPDESCKKTNSCPATILLTGNNKTLGLDLGGRFFPRSSIFKSPGVVNTLPNGVFGTVSKPAQTMFVDPSLLVPFPIYILQPTCSPSDVVLIPTGKRTAMRIAPQFFINLFNLGKHFPLFYLLLNSCHISFKFASISCIHGHKSQNPRVTATLTKPG